MSTFRKAVVAGALAAVSVLGTALANGGISEVDVAAALSAGLVAGFAVYKTKNAK